VGDRETRGLHASRVAEMNPVVIGLGVAAAALSARYFLGAYEKWDAARPKGGAALASKYYRGPFDDPMTRAEAAKILGIRESAPPEKVKERHRKLLMLNHPDAGGSTFLASKINEAKEKLLGGSG
jgi:DnaJ family protein C protein 19